MHITTERRKQGLVLNETIMKILLVEDQPRHISGAQRILTSHEVIIADNLRDALPHIDDVDVVMTDVFFPGTPGEDEQQNGLAIVEAAITAGKPVVMVTSTYHHGQKTEEVFQRSLELGVLMFDCYPSSREDRERSDFEGPNKPWEEALGALEVFQELRSAGRIISCPESPGFAGEGGRDAWGLAQLVYRQRTDPNYGRER